MKFFDANIFVRYLTRDDSAKSAACYALFRQLSVGADTATTSESVVAEVVFVLSSRNLYALAHSDIRARLKPLLSVHGLHLPERKLMLRALDLYALHPFLDFEDALSVAHMERSGLSEIMSYDRDFDRLSGVRRLEPEPASPNGSS